MKTVKITANPTTGQVFTQALNADGTKKTDKNGKEHGYIRVEAKQANLGFAYNKAIKVRSCLIAMTLEAYQGAADVLSNGSSHAGSIVREDSLTPFYEGQKPLQTPKKDADGSILEEEFNVITSNGAPVYRNERFVESQSAEDIKLPVYDKIEESVNAGKATILSK